MPVNKYLVGVQGETVVIGQPMRAARMTKEEALELAAWLVTMAAIDPENEFQPILHAVQRS